MAVDSKHITFRVDDPTYEFIRQLADARMMTMSQLIRHLIVEMTNPEYQRQDLDRQLQEISAVYERDFRRH
jgi:hypothetical protein